ncbi:glycosyltransferase [Candidatus Micrarchaeota archaeon]|nr:glycosyltransferase [Candidatus Micrarchaeota archaeon]
MASVSVLLPTLNEEESIESTINQVRKVLPDAEIVVIDGLSKDKTIEIAKKMGAKIILETQKGKAVAIKKAFKEIDTDYALMIDVDLTYPVEDFPKIIILLNEYDVVMGSRFRGKMEEGAMSFTNNFGNRIISLCASTLFLKWVSDVCTGMWGFRKRAYKNIEITSQTFELECNMFAQSVKKGFKVAEFPINYSKRGGTSKVQLIDGVKDCILLLKERFSP